MNTDFDMKNYETECFRRFCEVWDWSYRHGFQGLCRYYRADSLYMRNYRTAMVTELGTPAAFILSNDGSGAISPYRRVPPVELGGRKYAKLEFVEVSRGCALDRMPKMAGKVLDAAVAVLAKELKCDGLFVFEGDDWITGALSKYGMRSVKVIGRDLSEPRKKEPDEVPEV